MIPESRGGVIPKYLHHTIASESLRAGESFLSTVTAPTAHHGKIRMGRELERADHANYGTLYVLH